MNPYNNQATSTASGGHRASGREILTAIRTHPRATWVEIARILREGPDTANPIRPYQPVRPCKSADQRDSK